MTCAYFSVSATWNWRSPAALTSSASVCNTSSRGNATRASRSRSYSVNVTSSTSRSTLDRGKPSKSTSTSAWDSSRARSGRKLKKMIESPSSMRMRRPSLRIDTGGTNSSVTPAAYCASMYATASVATPSPSPAMVSYARWMRSQRRSRSIAKYRPETDAIAPTPTASSASMKLWTNPAALAGGSSRPSRNA